jgi:hydrogenase 3 maturation protease
LETEKSVEGLVLESLEKELFSVFLFIDAADFGGNPGDFKLFDDEEIDLIAPAFSTHKVPLSLLMSFIKQSGKKALLLGIQPETTQLFCKMSAKVRNASDKLTGQLRKYLSGN